MRLIKKPTGQYFDEYLFNYISSNGTMGVSDIACECATDSPFIYEIFKEYVQMQSIGSWFAWYTKKPTKPYEIFFESEYTDTFLDVNFTLEASNDYVNWTTLEITSLPQVQNAFIHIYPNNDNYYHYYRLSGFPDKISLIRIYKLYCVSLGSTTASILKPTRKYYKYIDTPWTQPIVTASSSTATSITTQGHTIYSCGGVRASGYPLSYLFDGSTAGSGCPIETASTGYVWTQVYNPNPIKASNIKIYWNAPGSAAITATVTIEASNDGENWTTLSSGTASPGAGFANIIEHNVSLSTNTNFYKYYKIINTTPYLASGHAYWYVREIEITAAQKTIVEGTSSDYDFYEDIVIYQAIV